MGNNGLKINEIAVQYGIEKPVLDSARHSIGFPVPLRKTPVKNGTRIEYINYYDPAAVVEFCERYDQAREALKFKLISQRKSCRQLSAEILHQFGVKMSHTLIGKVKRSVSRLAVAPRREPPPVNIPIPDGATHFTRAAYLKNKNGKWFIYRGAESRWVSVLRDQIDGRISKIQKNRSKTKVLYEWL